ncbi:MAG: 3-methylcrotonyl-CoA carboxylase, partial [Rhodocyclaceae bacterium]|nr:3-methylcrotonyl-CoA carboxylase [Rhodocyclaceae bacterium]
AARRTLAFRFGETEKAVAVAYQGEGFALELDGLRVPAQGALGAGSALRADFAGNRINATVVVAGEKRHVFLHGRAFVLSAVDPLYHAGEGGGAEGGLTAPMPGKVIALVAAEGAAVEKGAPLLILEAMKMEHTIAAPCKGTVKAFRFGVGDQVADGAELVEFEAAS